jgi:hypothetical protein
VLTGRGIDVSHPAPVFSHVVDSGQSQTKARAISVLHRTNFVPGYMARTRLFIAFMLL